MSSKSIDETISITLRCYVLPSDSPHEFELGKTFFQQYPTGTTLKPVIDRLLGVSAEIGLIAINGELVKDWEMALHNGDHIDIFPLVGGG